LLLAPDVTNLQSKKRLICTLCCAALLSKIQVQAQMREPREAESLRHFSAELAAAIGLPAMARPPINFLWTLKGSHSWWSK
jgi:hypothetical protein